MPAGLSLLLALSAGSFIYYNTNVLNTYEPDDARQDRLARYERDGYGRRVIKNLTILTRYFLGASPETLAKDYR